MEVEANRDGSMCLRDFTDTLMRENTIYFEHLQKGDTNMSTKDWKNGELKGLLTEAWGFQMDLSKLNEGEKMPMEKDAGDADGDGDTEDKVPAFLKKEAAADDADAEVVEEEVVEEDEEVVKEEFPGESDMNTHKRDLSEARLKEIIAYALKTKG